MNKIKTISLLVSLAATNAFSADFNEYVEISNGHYAKVSADGTLTEIATSADARIELNKDTSEEQLKKIKSTIINGKVSVTTNGLNMCGGFVINPWTDKTHDINQDNN